MSFDKNKLGVKKKSLNDILLNYTLTVGFIFIIVIFISLLILISRYVLIDTSVQNHVELTKNILDNINEVEKNLNQTNNTQTINLEDFNPDYKVINLSQKFIDGWSYFNSKENSSYFTFKFNKPIYNISDYFYILDFNFSSYKKGDPILFMYSQRPTFGYFISFENNMKIYVYNPKIKSVIVINNRRFIGRVIFLK
jgi:hypothetical protein